MYKYFSNICFYFPSLQRNVNVNTITVDFVLLLPNLDQRFLAILKNIFNINNVKVPE